MSTARALAFALSTRTGRHASRDAVRAFQDAQLRRLVAHAYHNVSYYRQLFDRHGVRPVDIRGVVDLPRIPMTSRDDLQSATATDLVAKGVGAERLTTVRTSGSSGAPLHIRSDRLERWVAALFRLHVLHDFGMRGRDRRAAIGRPHLHRATLADLPQRLIRGLGLYRWEAIDCVEPLSEILRWLVFVRPDVVFSYPNVVAQIAELATDDDRRRLHPRLVISGAEVLTPHMREQIARGLGTQVVDWYGSHELGTIAWECTRAPAAYHVADSGVLLEVLEDGRPVADGESGEVVGTNLYKFSMPFIRYRQGDIVTRGAAVCACGAPFPTIRVIQGRMLDYFPLADGRLLHPYGLSSALVDASIAWIRQLTVTQECATRFVLTIVPRVTPSSGDLAALEQETVRHLGPGTQVEIRLVDEIPLEPTGKFRLYRSRVQSQYDGVDWAKLHASGS
jgi:phenylacetate-CoA ligase